MTESDSMIKIPFKALQMNMLFSTYCDFKVICQVKIKMLQLDLRLINKKIMLCPICGTEYLETVPESCSICEWNLTSESAFFANISFMLVLCTLI